MDSRGLAFKQLVRQDEPVMCDELPVSGSDRAKYVMPHDWPAHGVEITEDAAVFHHLVSYEPGVATVEVEENLEAHRRMLELDLECVDRADARVVTDRHMAEHVVSGRAVWTETDGDTVSYDLSADEQGDEGLVDMPEIVQVFEYVPFQDRVYSLDNLEQELTALFDCEIQF